MASKKKTTGIKRVCLMFGNNTPWTALHIPTTLADDLVQQFKKGTMPAIISGSYTEENGRTGKKYYKTDTIIGIEVHEI